MEIKGYSLINEEKVERALNGTPKDDSTTIGGIGGGAYREDGVWKREGEELNEKEVDVLETALLAEYDKLGGLIKRGNDKVKTGSFFNLKSKKPFDVPQVMFVYRVNGKLVEIPDGKELPGEVRAAKILEEEAALNNEEVEEKVEKKKGKKK